MNRAQLLKLAPKIGARADVFVDALNAAMEQFGIDTTARQAPFIAQAIHESLGLTRMTENLNYSPASLIATFNSRSAQRFSQGTALLYGRTEAHPANQQMIANTAYANRMGNGSVESGDGWRYRGRGPGQLTGKSNYEKCGAALGLDLVNCPDLVAQPDVGCLAFAWFWACGNRTGASLNILADSGRIDTISRAINGGDNGLLERKNLTDRTREVLA